MTLHLYFARRFLLTFLAVFGAFFLMLSLFDLLEQIRRFGGTEANLQGILALTFLNVPKSVYRIMPLIVIISAIFYFLSLSRASELVVIRAAGRSASVMLVPAVVVAFCVGAAAVAVVNPIVAATLKQYETLANRYQSGAVNALSLSREGLWLRQSGEDGQTVIRAAASNLNGTVLTGATFMTFGPGGVPERRLEAERAELGPGQWTLTGVKDWALATSDNPERDARRLDSLTLSSDLTADEILDSFGDPAAIPVWELPAFIDRLEAAGFSARIHRVWYHVEISLPVLLSAMVLVAAGFTMRHSRFGNTGVMVLMALGSGFALYFVRNFAQVLGENGQIPVLLAAWAPAVATLLLPIGLILHLEDG